MSMTHTSDKIFINSLPLRNTRAILGNLPFIQLLGVRIHTLSLDQLLPLLDQVITNKEKILLAYANVHALNLAYSSPRFRQCLNRADIVFCDGFGVKWGARLLGMKISQRYTPPDWIASLSIMCAQQGFSLFLLGAEPGVAERAALALRAHACQPQIVGVYHGYFDKTMGGKESEMVIEKINSTRPDILVVGFGMPLQEYWLEENWHRIHAKVALPVGAALDFIAGTTYRGPRWLTDYGLEWLTRLVIEPRRLWKRYLLGNPIFLWRIFKQRLGLL